MTITNQQTLVDKNSINNIPVNDQMTVITPKSSWRLFDFKELVEYRDLFFYLTWRNIKVLYAQTILGFFWAILVPAIQIIIFTIVFGKVARIETDGIPYVLYSTVAIIPWTFMSQAMGQSSMSLVEGQALLGKVYFPRILFPITPLFSRLVDFGISLIIIIGVMIYYQIMPSARIFCCLFFSFRCFWCPPPLECYFLLWQYDFEMLKLRCNLCSGC